MQLLTKIHQGVGRIERKTRIVECIQNLFVKQPVQQILCVFNKQYLIIIKRFVKWLLC
jgi:hypothetical protein